MKKPAFIITEVIFSLLLTASVSAIGVLVYDLNTNALHLNGVNPFTQQTAVITEESEKPSQEPSKASKAETSVESKASETEKQVSEPSAEESKEPAIQLRKSAGTAGGIRRSPQSLRLYDRRLCARGSSDLGGYYFQ